MKLIDAPTIVAQIPASTDWVIAAAVRTRALHQTPPQLTREGKDQSGFYLKQLAEDIWSSEEPVYIHTDKTRRGFRVFGLVLINDPALRLVTNDGIFPLPVGTVYHIDGRSPHAALPMRKRSRVGLFGFMAWDVRKSTDIDDMLASLPDAMGAYARGEERVDISMGHLP